jgi:creatinine amidohydrolase
MTIHFQTQRSPQLEGAAKAGTLIVLPIGATEEHGRHLPVNTDCVIAERMALAAAERVAGQIPVLVMPTIWTGYSDAHLKQWPGTITIRPKTLIDLMYDVLASLVGSGFKKILIVNGPGNNPGPIDCAVRMIGDDLHVYCGISHVWTLYDRDEVLPQRRSAPGGWGHGGEDETSLMLHLTGDVDMSQATDADRMRSQLATCPVDIVSTGKRVYLSTWHLTQSTTGLCGDPTPATAEFGKLLFESAVKNLIRVMHDYVSVPT